MTDQTPTLSVNRRAAQTVCQHAVDVDDARMLLEMLGLVAAGGNELLPDDVQFIPKELLALEVQGSRPPVVVREPPNPRDLIPEGLRNLAPAPPRPPQRRPHTLTEELDDLERTDPDVAAASRSYDDAVDRLLAKPVPPAAPPKEKPMPTRAQEQTRALLKAVAPPTPPPLKAVPPTPTTAGGPYVAALSVVELFVDRTYQRPLDEPRVKRMVKDWQPRMLGILDVSDRGPDANPRYALVDGQQRWTAAGRVGVQYVACNVHEGLSVDDEARLMFDLDRTKKKLNGWDKWRARRGAGDQAVVTVERIAAAHGLRVDDTGELRSYGTAEKLLAAGGEELLDTAIAILHTAYGPTVAAFQAPLLMGVGQLLHRHGADIDPDRLTRALAGKRPEEIRATATALREVDGGPLHELMTRAIAGQYNRLPGPRIGRAA